MGAENPDLRLEELPAALLAAYGQSHDRDDPGFDPLACVETVPTPVKALSQRNASTKASLAFGSGA